MRSVRVCLSALAAFLLVAAPRLTSAEPKAGPNDFSSKVAPFVKQHCVKCHGPVKAKGQLVLSTLTGSMSGRGSEAPLWKVILEQIQTGEMPPPGEPRPSAAALAQVTGWINRELKSAKANSGYGSPLPGRGNDVDHDLLFGTKAAGGPNASPPRLWRLSLALYESNLIRTINLDKKVLERNDLKSILVPDANNDSKTHTGLAPPWSFHTGGGFKDYAALYRVDEAETDILISNAMFTAGRMLRAPAQKPPSKFSLALAAFRSSKDSAEPTPEVSQSFIQGSFRLILRRDPFPEELEKYLPFLSKNLKDLGKDAGLQTTLTAILLHAEAVFRFELGQPPGPDGRAILTPRELAYAIAYALTEKEPDAELVQAAENGKLASRDDVKAQVERLLNDDSIDKPRIVQFFREYFGYGKVVDNFKDDDVVKKSGLKTFYTLVESPWPELMEVLVGDTDDLVSHVLRGDRQVLKELLTTNKTFVSLTSRFRLNEKNLNYQFYNLRVEEKPSKNAKPPKQQPLDMPPQVQDWSPMQPLELPAEHRAGVLTQPSWLIAFSTNTDNHAIDRGKWVREHLLGEAIPDVPITVDANLSADPHLTLREKMKITRQAFCWQCHRHMDPLGLPFEMFDPFGRYRTTELGKPVDATGELVGSGDPKLDGPVANALDLMKKLAESERVRQVFVRHAFRFWMGRNETVADAATLQAAHRAYVESDGSMKALIASLLTSDEFLYRWTGKSIDKRGK